MITSLFLKNLYKIKLLCILIILFAGCTRYTHQLKTLLFPNNPWNYKSTQQENWTKGEGSICQDYENIYTESNDSVIYLTKFEWEKTSIKNIHIEINIQGNFRLYINNHPISSVNLLPYTIDTTNIKTDEDVRIRARAHIKQTLSINKSYLEPGINELKIVITAVDKIMDFPVNVIIRAYTRRKTPWRKVFRKFPEISIDTYNSDIPDDPKINAWLSVKEGKQITESAVAIEIRGHSSQIYPKKSFGFETQDSLGKNNNISLLGLPAENDWVLYAPYIDKTLMRNVLAYKIFRDMGHYSVRTRFCELYLNESYEGVYVLIEKIKRDKNRVAISKFKNDITGGYMVSNDRSTSTLFFPSTYYHDYNTPIPFYCIYPDSSDLTEDALNYIMQQFHRFEQSVVSGDREAFKKHMDITSFADYLLLSELTRNNDAYRLSTFYYKNSDSVDPKIYMGPVWDYNLAFGLADYDNAYSFEGWIFRQNKNLIPFWWDDLMSNPYFYDFVKSRWFELRNNILSEEKLNSQIDSIASQLYFSARHNYKRWPILWQGIWPSYYNGPTYEDNVDYLKFWLFNRLRWMDKNI